MGADLPTRIGRYEIRKELGRGMMGVVYQAHDPDLLRSVALKTISLAFAVSPAERAEFEKRFLVEARAAAGLSHPGIVVVHEVGADAASGTLYMALEYLRGKTLEQLVAQGGRLEWRHALQITARVAEALHHAHTRGIIHRDVKPANIMVLENGPKVMDFGVAKISAEDATTGGRVFGSPSYMSPEQATGEPLTPRSDLFSLGAVLYEALTGTRAFAGPNVPAILRRVAREHPTPPSQSVPGIPREVDEIVARLLAKEPMARYTTGMALAEDIEDVLAGRAPGRREPLTRPRSEPATLVPRGAPPQPARAMPPRAPGPPEGEGTIRAGAGPTLALPPGKRVSLAILTGPRQGEVFVLERPQILIGRAEGQANAQVEVPDPEMSRAHAVLECHGSRLVVRDMGSTNGTFVGEARITEKEIENRGEFRVGRTRFMVIVADID